MKLVRKIVGGVVMLMFCASMAEAQATRTWVSGVGDDANPCSRTAPCKTFAGAISKTATNGEISVLDPGGFGALTITKAITVDGGGIQGSILAGSVFAITINIAAPTNATSEVIIRNININGANTAGSGGIRVLTGGARAVYIDNVHINNVLNAGIDFLSPIQSLLFVSNSVIRKAAGGGIRVRTPSAAAVGTRRAMIVNTVIEGSAFGILSDSSQLADSVFVSCREVVVSGAGAAGFQTTGSGARLAMHNSTSSNNATGVQAAAGTFLTMIDSASILNVGDNNESGVITKVSGNFPP